MKKLLLLLLLSFVSVQAYCQCAGVTGTGTSTSNVHITCTDSVKTLSVLNAVKAVNLTVTNTIIGSITGSATSAPTQQRNTLVMLGDSYTAFHLGGTAPGVTTPTTGYFNWANMKMKRKFQIINYAGVAGQTTTQISARFAANVTALNPGWVAIQGGINDVNASVSAATIYANLTAMYALALAQNIRVIAFTIPIMPVFATQAKYNIANDVNTQLKQYARTQNNFILIDWNIIVTDPETGIVQSQYTFDNTHFSLLADAVVGDFIAQKLDVLLPDVDMLPSSANDVYTNNTTSAFTNLCPNGMMTGNSSGLATSWNPNVTLSTSGSGVLNTDYTQSKVANFNIATGSLRSFDWQQLQALTASGAVKQFAFRPSTSAMAGTWNTGDYLYVECEFEADNDWSGVTKMHLALNTLVSSGSVVNSIDMFTNGTANGTYPGSTTPQYIPSNGVLRTYPVQMTSLVTSVYPEFDFYAVTGTIRVGRFSIRKATPVVVGGVTTFLY